MQKYLFILLLVGVYFTLGTGLGVVHAAKAGEKGCTPEKSEAVDDSAAGTTPTAGKALICLGGVWTVKLASVDGGLPESSQVPGTGSLLIERVGTITNWVFAVFVAISVIYIVLAAFQFVTGGGKPEEVSAARQKLIYAVIGIAIALLARALPVVLRNIIIT